MANDDQRLRRRFDRVLVAGFCALLALPLLDEAFGLDPLDLSGIERDPLPGAPTTAAEVAEWPEHAWRYWNSNFGFRASLLKAHLFLQAEVFAASPTPAVRFGKDGWLFFEETLASYEARVGFSEADRRGIRARLGRRDAWFRARGTTYLLAYAPNKNTVYPERMADEYGARGETRRLDQIRELAREAGVAYVDLLAPLLDAKAEHRLYHRTDTHWNRLGGLVAEGAFARRLRALGLDAKPACVVGPDLGTMPLERPPSFAPGVDVRFAWQPGWEEGDLARMAGRTGSLTEPIPIDHWADESPLDGISWSDRTRLGEQRFDHRVSRAPSAPLGRAVVVHDSFGFALSWLARHFREAVWVRMDPGPLPDFVWTEVRPDVVLHVHVERHLMRGLPPLVEAETAR